MIIRARGASNHEVPEKAKRVRGQDVINNPRKTSNQGVMTSYLSYV